MTKDDGESGQPLGGEHYKILSNAGRCDVCGRPIDMESGDRVSIMEFGVGDEVTEEHGVTDQDAANSVADALERVGDSGADYDLAETIREEQAMKVHDSCLNERTSFDSLTWEPETEEGGA